ncbi:hypothetical protein GF327_05970 [Candidatus Woesearchaeota archaeon]|nr:hypothetical protein [Candidatus Woesearchaeota archaeon]
MSKDKKQKSVVSSVFREVGLRTSISSGSAYASTIAKRNMKNFVRRGISSNLAKAIAKKSKKD